MAHIKYRARFGFSSLATVLALTALAAGCGHQKNQAAGQDGVLRVGFIGTTGGLPSGPEGWAQHDGLLIPTLKSQGVKSITFTAFPNGPDLNEAIAAGALDVGMLGDTPAIVGHAAGIPTRLINQTAVGNNCWLLVRNDGPKTVDDLKGKTIATAKGSYMARYLLGLLVEKGLTRHVRFVHLVSTESEAALRRGDIAAYASGQGPLLVAHGGLRVIDQAAQHPGLEGSGVTVMTDRYLAAHPGFPADWNRARAAGITDIQTHLADYYREQAARVHLPPATYEALFPIRHPKPLTPRGAALLNGTKTFLLQQKQAKSDFSIADWAVPGEYPTGNTNVASRR